MVLELLNFGVAEFCCQSWFQQQWWAQEGGDGLGVIQRAAGSSAFLKSALAASSNPLAHILGLTEQLWLKRDMGAGSDTVSLGRSSPVLGRNSCFSHRTTAFSLQCSAEGAQAPGSWALSRHETRCKEETNISVVWPVNCLEMNPCSLAQCMILSINFSPHHLLHLLPFTQLSHVGYSSVGKRRQFLQCVWTGPDSRRPQPALVTVVIQTLSR